MGDVDFDRKDKVTKPGSNYSNYDSGMTGNYSQKDASLSRMKSSNKKGQSVTNYTGTNEVSMMTTGSTGGTAHNNNPIKEVYTPATSHGIPPADGIVRPSKSISNKA